jgi:hypothetical protein
MNERLLAASLSANSLNSPGDLKNLGNNGTANPQEQLKQVLETVIKNRRRDYFFLRVIATVTADNKNVMFFNALELNTNATSEAGVAFSTNAPAGYTKLLKALAKESLAVRGLVITVSDEALWSKNWYLTDGDFMNQRQDEFNSALDAAKQQITDDPKTRIVPIDFLLDGYTGIYVEDVDGGTTTQTIKIVANVVGVPTRIR